MLRSYEPSCSIRCSNGPIRWNPVDEGSLREFLAVQLESNDFIENYVLSLKPLAYLEPDHYSHK